MIRERKQLPKEMAEPKIDGTFLFPIRSNRLTYILPK
jgi:hypothetical protein